MLKELGISMQMRNAEIAQIIKLCFKKLSFQWSFKKLLPSVLNIQTIFYSRQFLSFKCQKDKFSKCQVPKQKGLIFQQMWISVLPTYREAILREFQA